MVLLIIIALSPLATEAYQREGYYGEIWYQFSVAQLIPGGESALDTAFNNYGYRFVIRSRGKSDSAVFAGVRSVPAGIGTMSGGAVTDYLPVNTYPGEFEYKLSIRTRLDTLEAEGDLTIPPDTLPFFLSDLMLGKKNFSETFTTRGIKFVPRIVPDYSRFDTLLAWLEIYGLTPDNRFFVNAVQVVDETGKVPIRKILKRLKCEPVQAETVSVSLLDLGPGRYRLEWEVTDPANHNRASVCHPFEVKAGLLDKKLMVYYQDINYLVSSNEYKRFQKTSEPEQEMYLKSFWSRNDYWEFARRIEAADESFSTRAMRGRDSERGKYCIKNGPPDEIEKVALSEWARPFEVWHYNVAGYDALFCDTREDNNPVLIRILKPGELTTILEMDVRNGDEGEWLDEIAPGTFRGNRKNDEE